MPQHHPALRRTASRLALAAGVTILGACSGTGDDDQGVIDSPGTDAPVFSDGPTQFEMAYRSRGTEVLDCVLPNREFDITVFGPATFSVTAVEDGTPLVIRIDDTTYLASSLFGADDVESKWLALDDEKRKRFADALKRALGRDLSAYVLADSAPDNGSAIALDALSTNPEVSSIDPRGGPRALTDGYRFIVDGVEDQLGIVLDIWIDTSGDIVRLQVQRALADQPDAPNPDSGWIIEYLPLPDSADPPSAPADVADGDALDPDSLAAPVQRGCDLEIGPEPDTPSGPRA